MTSFPLDRSIDELEHTARKLRGRIIEMSHKSGAAHLGSALSCVEMLFAAYAWGVRVDPRRPHAEDRDRLILSKGHAASALYAVAAEVGFFPEALLDTFGENGGKLPEQPAPRLLPGVEAATGSLGHGLSFGVGMALASRIRGLGFRVVVIMSDGECNEGSVWEAAMFAAAQKLDNLTVLIDYNKWQATGRSNEVMALAPLEEKFRAFGWAGCEVDGHDLGKLRKELIGTAQSDGRPTVFVCHTIKGRGVSFMEDDNNWHYRVPTAEEVARARQELGLDGAGGAGDAP